MIEQRQYQVDDVLRQRIIAGCRVDDAGCWLWIGWKHRQGYGLMTINKKRFLAHRVSYSIFRGSIQDGAHICHHCDITECVNPDHLYAGSAKTNRADCISRGRDNTSMLLKRGNERPDSKLTETSVLEIRQSNESTYALAKKYGVCHQTISRVRLKQSWTHI